GVHAVESLHRLGPPGRCPPDGERAPSRMREPSRRRLGGLPLIVNSTPPRDARAIMNAVSRLFPVGRRADCRAPSRIACAAFPSSQSMSSTWKTGRVFFSRPDNDSIIGHELAG